MRAKDVDMLEKMAGAAAALGQRIKLELTPVWLLLRCEKDNLQKQGQAPYTCPTVLEIGFEPASALHHQINKSAYSHMHLYHLKNPANAGFFIVCMVLYTLTHIYTVVTIVYTKVHTKS